MSQVRLQKFLAEAGLGSRRACEAIILAGRVVVNGQPVRQLGTKIHPGKDGVSVDGTPVRSRKKVYLALNKPRGVLCARKDPSPKPVVNSLLPSHWSHLYCIGRLDLDTEGLLLMTNDGAFSNRVAHPRYGARKTYQVIVSGRFPAADLVKLTQGLRDRGQWLRAESANLLSANNTRSRLKLTLTEGKNREVRRLLASLGFKVEHLQRTQVGSVKLGELPPGKWRTLTESEIKSLLPLL